MIAATDILAPERAKYAAVWGIDSYRDYSPGGVNVERFVKVLGKPSAYSTLVDFGCGAGNAGLAFAEMGLDVTWVDLTDAGLMPEVPRQRFFQQPLWERVRPSAAGLKFDYGFCCDVMEHIAPEFTMLALANMIAACKVLWLQIALRPDAFGALVGEPLHLTVRPFVWWRDRLAALGQLAEARDLCADGLFVVKPK